MVKNSKIEFVTDTPPPFSLWKSGKWPFFVFFYRKTDIFDPKKYKEQKLPIVSSIQKTRTYEDFQIVF